MGTVKQTNIERMATRVYPIEDVLRVACERANVTKLQVGNTKERHTPQWAPMARAAVCGAVYELCEISLPEMAAMFGHKTHTGCRDQVISFRERWPVMIRRAWLETVLVGLDDHPYPEIKNP